MYLKCPDIRRKTLSIFTSGFVWYVRLCSSLVRIYLRNPSGV